MFQLEVTVTESNESRRNSTHQFDGALEGDIDPNSRIINIFEMVVVHLPSISTHFAIWDTRAHELAHK